MNLTEAKRRERISSLEKNIAEIEARETQLNMEIAENAADFELIGRNCAELEELKARHEELMEEWLLISEEE